MFGYHFLLCNVCTVLIFISRERNKKYIKCFQVVIHMDFDVFKCKQRRRKSVSAMKIDCQLHYWWRRCILFSNMALSLENFFMPVSKHSVYFVCALCLNRFHYSVLQKWILFCFWNNATRQREREGCFLLVWLKEKESISESLYGNGKWKLWVKHEKRKIRTFYICILFQYKLDEIHWNGYVQWAKVALWPKNYLLYWNKIAPEYRSYKK